jgi:hypothetical protein
MSLFSDFSNTQISAFTEAHGFFSDSASEKQFNSIFSSIASLQAWLEYFVDTNRFSEKTQMFFFEAVNDAILSCYFARVGTWRPAIQSLRSTLENCLQFLYYKDHLVELKLWENQKHKIGFQRLEEYLKQHPILAGHDHQSETGLVQIEQSYSLLSKAVHGSVDGFRMVSKSPGKQLPSIHVNSMVELSRYRTLVRSLFEALNQLLVAIFNEELQGTALPSLRQAIAHATSAGTRRTVKKAFKVVLQ